MNELSLLDSLFGNDGFALPSYREAAFAPKVDVVQKKDSYVLSMDLPGKTDKDVKIELNHNVLTISSEKKNEKDEKSEKKEEGKWLVKERSYQKFSRSFTLPEDVEAEKVSAEVKNGVLTVTMPRKALPEPKRIAIKSA